MHTTSLEVSKKLKEAGYPQDHTDCHGGFWLCDPGEDEWYFLERPLIMGDEEIAYAPTLGELIRELPNNVSITGQGVVFIHNTDTGQVKDFIIPDADTPEDACGLTLVELIKGERNNERNEEIK